MKKTLGKDRRLSVFNVVAPQDGGWSLTPMENLLRGLRGHDNCVAMEIYGRDGIVGYSLRTTAGETMAGMMHAYYPQARLDKKTYENGISVGDLDVKDWLHLDEDEFALVQTLSLEQESYLPLRILDDRTIEQSRMDPLAGVIGLLSSSSRSGGEFAGDRLGVRLVVKPAAENWNAPWRNRMQERRDGDDRNRPPGGGGQQSSGMSFSAMAAIGGLAAIAGLNYWLWSEGHRLPLVPLNAALGLLGMGGYWLYKKFTPARRRQYIDEELIDAKLKSLAFYSELQLVRIYRHVADEEVARVSLENLVDCLRSFDDPVGNSWKVGKIRPYRGVEVYQEGPKHPFLGGNESLDFLEKHGAAHTIMSAREVASLWHMPLGMDEMASMERTAAGMLVPYLADLLEDGEDAGPLVGIAEGTDHEIRLPESSVRKHSIILGRSGVGKSTMIKHVIHHKLQRKAAGLDRGAVVVIDPHADLVRDIMQMVPPEIADKVRLLDFGRTDRVPGINLVDPYLFTDRDRCVDTIVNTVRHLWDAWGNRLEDLLKRGLSIIYEYNSHPDTGREDMLTMLDILALLDGGQTVGRGNEARVEKSPYQKHVLSRVSDPRLHQWFDAFLEWAPQTRSEAVGPVHSRIGAYASNVRASTIMGQNESTILLSDILSEGLVLLVSSAQGTVGVQPAALMGGTMVSLVEAALRDQEKLAFEDRNSCLLVCDEFQTVTGADWEGLLAEIRKYGGALMLATQSLARLDTAERKLKAGILGNVGVIVGYQMSAEDAAIISPEMDEDRVKRPYLVNLNPHCCYVRINSDKKCYPAFSMRTLAPPDKVAGSDLSRAAVLESSREYTVDMKEIQKKLDEGVRSQLDMNKLAAAGGGGGSAAAGNAGGGQKSKRETSLFNMAMESTRTQQGAGGGGNEGRREQELEERKKQELRRTLDRERETKGTLRGVPVDQIRESVMSRELMEQLAKVPANDPGLKGIVDKVVGDQVRSRVRSGLREKEREIEQLKADYEARLAAAGNGDSNGHDAGEAEVEAALAEVAAGIGEGDGDGGIVPPPRGGPRDLGQLRRVGAPRD